MKVTWESGDAYELYMGRWSRMVAKEFLPWLEPAEGLRWLDVGCSTGTLSDLIMSHYKPASLVAVDSSESFIKSARMKLKQGVELHTANARDLPLEDNSVDITVSGLLLNFPADPVKALSEMVRVTTPGGMLAAYVWDYASGVEMLHHFWEAAVELDLMAEVMHEGKRFADCNKPAMKQMFQDAGLQEITLKAIEIEQQFADFEQFWTPFRGGQDPAPTYLMSRKEEEQEALRELVKARLPIAADGSIKLRARAWAIKATVGEKGDAVADDESGD